MSFRRGIKAAALAAVAVATPGRARADGAFPAGEAVIVPADRPEEIMLVTNFGLVTSEDGGQTWSWSCERDENALGIFYQLGPAPRRRLFTVANHHVVYSDDASCSWQVAGGLLDGQAVTDVFPDPGNADRVVAIGIASGAASVFESADGGATFGSTLYQAQNGDAVNGVEIARADPRILYLALMSPDQSPKLARTADGGAHWTVNDLSADLGPGSLRIIAVDPGDANTVLVRWSAAADGSEAIGLTRDGGATATKPLAIRNYFTSFARMPDGALILSAMASVSPANVPTLYLSRDGGASFEENPAVPGVLALAARDGILYAAADNVADGYALGASSDEGVTWQPVVRFDQIASISACLRTNAQCQASCEALAGKGLGSPGTIWDEAVCTGVPAGSGSGGGAGAGGAGAPGGGGGAAGSNGGGPGGSGGGGGCAVAAGRPGSDLGTAGVVAALMLLTLHRRGKRMKLTARSAFAVLLGVMVLGCSSNGGTPQPVMCFGANVVANESNDYKFSSTITLSPVTVAPMSNLTFDWSGLTKDFLGRSLVPATDLDAAIVMIWNFPLATFETELNADALYTADLIFSPPVNLPLAGATSGHLYDFLLNGTPLMSSMFDAYFDAAKVTPDKSTCLVGVQTGTDLGRNMRMLQAFNLDASSSVTNVALTNTSTSLSYTANLHDLTITGVPGGTPALTLDWTNMTTNALGHEFTQGSVTSAVVGHYTETPGELETNFLNLDSLALETYRATIQAGSVLDFTTLTDASGGAFPGITSDGTWLVGLICGNCRNPAPWYMTILKPCSM